MGNKEKIKFRGFPTALIKGVVCQDDFGKLFLKKQTSGSNTHIISGALECEKCKKEYKIEKGILNLLSGQPEINEVLKTEIVERNKESQRYDRRMQVRHYKEMVSMMSKIGNIKNKKIIEYGCGTGRLTVEIMDKCESILAIDFSLESLLLLSNKINQKAEIGLVLADATQVKTKPDFFDKALSAQFIEHIPRKDKRLDFLTNVYNTLKLGGKFISTVYHQDLRRAIKKQAQEGFYKNGIFFHFFSINELKGEFEQIFSIKKLVPIDITLPLEARIFLPLRIGGLISRICEKIFAINKFGHLLFIEAEKNNGNCSQGINYIYPSIYFKKKWFWFANPMDVKNIDLVNFFSYNNVDIPGFKKKKGLTTIIDLKNNIEDLWQKTRKSFIRKQIKRGEKNGITVKRDFNFKGFKKIYSAFRKSKNISKDNFRAFKENGLLFSAYYNEKLIASGVYICRKPHIRAWALASLRIEEKDGKIRDIIGQANRMIIWEAIKYAKSEGFEFFDLGGINPNSEKQKDISLAQFKEAFGGERKECFYYYKVYSKLLKFLMRLR